MDWIEPETFGGPAKAARIRVGSDDQPAVFREDLGQRRQAMAETASDIQDTRHAAARHQVPGEGYIKSLTSVSVGIGDPIPGVQGLSHSDLAAHGRGNDRLMAMSIGMPLVQCGQGASRSWASAG